MSFLHYFTALSLLLTPMCYSMEPLSSPSGKPGSSKSGPTLRPFNKYSATEQVKKPQKIPVAGENLPSQEKPADTKYLGFPGIVANRDGKWLWSDNLLNLSKNITVSVEIAKPDDLNLDFDVAKLEDAIGEVLGKYGITMGAIPEPGKPDLPNFHVLVMVYPIKDGYTFATQATLLEQVLLNRIKLDGDVTMQAITWGRQSIHIVSKGQLDSEIEKSVLESANAFGERFAFFDKMRSQR